MPRYQKQIRIATSTRLIGLWKFALLAALIPVLLAVKIGVSVPEAHAEALVATADETVAQTQQPSAPQLYLLPGGTTPVVLSAHIARLRLDAAGDGTTLTSLQGTYLLKNQTSAATVVDLRLIADNPGGDTALEGVALTADGNPLALQNNDAGGYEAQVQVGADSQVNLQLRYAANLGATMLPTVRYAPSVLNEWPGTVSLRVDMLIADAFPPDSWMQVSPEGWSYALSSDANYTDLKWLYDGTIPAQPFIVQVVSPAYWQQIQVLEQSLGTLASPADHVRLGNLYRRLYGEAADDMLRDRFYAQAVAAYVAGINSAESVGMTGQDVALLHIGLANLYRSRVLDASPQAARHYAELLVAEAEAALSLLALEDGHRRELVQWQADGLRILLNHARERREWEAAMGILDRMATLPPDTVSPERIAQDRRSVEIRQALQLMEQGNRDAALALAGPSITQAELAPPLQSQSLFESWQVSVTAGLDTRSVVAAAQPEVTRRPAAIDGLRQIMDNWEALLGGISGENGVEVSLDGALDDDGQDQEPVRLTITLSQEGDAGALARSLPPDPDWALLGAVLAQLQPTIETDPQLVWQQVKVSQTFDLRRVGDQWSAMAAGLARQAQEFDDLANALSGGVAEDAQAALQARIKAANFRTAANGWTDLARHSWVYYSLGVDRAFRLGDNPPITRSWYAAVDTPAQLLQLQAEVLHTGRFVGMLALGLVFVVLLSLVLWWLL